jgi:hypothetical protein
MPTTYVYATTDVDQGVDLQLRLLGPANLSSAKLLTQSLGAHDAKKRIADIPRWIDGGVYVLDVPFTIAGTYVASLQLMLNGHGLGSMIWWRWRAAQADVGTWLTDHKSHAVTVDARGNRYQLQVTGASSAGYDDVDVVLKRV